MLIPVLDGKLVIGLAELGDIMKIFELFENPNAPIQGDAKEGDEKSSEYTFDLDEDIIYFMHNNDDFYRKSFFPILKVCKNKFDNGTGFSHRMFMPVVSKAYESYKKEFPIKELKEKLEEEDCEKIARKIYETELGHMKDGKYE